MMKQRFEILFFPTMRCNLRCDYCHFDFKKGGGWEGYGVEHKVDRELEWFEWLVHLAKLRPYQIEITGGEPLKYDGLAAFLDHSPGGTPWAITSNTLLDPTALPLRGCYSWTASWHGKAKDTFKANLIHLARSGVRPSVSIVVRPDKVAQAKHDAQEFAPMARVNFLRELNPGVDWDREHLPQWRELVKVAGEVGANLVIDDIPPNYTFPTYDFCDAGHKYICLMPDGQVYRCYSDAMMRPELTLGHISEFEPLPPGEPCGNPCAGCAVDFRQCKWSKGDAEGNETISAAG